MKKIELAKELVKLAGILYYQKPKIGERIGLKGKSFNQLPVKGKVLIVEHGDDNLKVVLTETKDGFQVTDYMNGGDMMRPITTYCYKTYNDAKEKFDKTVKEF